MIVKLTEEGFLRIENLNNQPNCSVEETIKARKPSLLIGNGCNRMQLNQEQLSELLPYLERFARTGCLAAVDKERV